MPGGLLRRSSRTFRQPIRSCPRIICRFTSTGVAKGEQLGPIQRDDHQSYRVRKDGKALPLPPVLDEVIVEERGRWEQTKAKPKVANFTPFQKKLWENPYAHALASPLRQCRSTAALLPSALLLSLHPRLHPETQDPWLLPVDLTTSSKHLGVPYRFLVRRAIAERLGKKKHWKSGIYGRFTEKLGSKVARLVWREDMPELILSLLQKDLAKKLEWYMRHPGHLQVCLSPRSEDVERFDNVSCVIVFGSLKTPADDIQAKTQKIVEIVEDQAKNLGTLFAERFDPHKAKNVTHKAPSWYRGPIMVPQLQPRLRFPPLEFKTTEWRGVKVAVYSLFDLLGEDRVNELVKGSKYEDVGCVVVKGARHNVPLELQLMQLQAYVAKSGP